MICKMWQRLRGGIAGRNVLEYDIESMLILLTKMLRMIEKG